MTSRDRRLDWSGLVRRHEVAGQILSPVSVSLIASATTKDTVPCLLEVMALQRLSWRIGLPFALFVLFGSMALVLWMGWLVSREDRRQFETLARTNANFLDEVNLPPSESMARQLAEVLGLEVRFRREGQVTPAANPEQAAVMDAYPEVPADGLARRTGARSEIVAVPLRNGSDLLLLRAADVPAVDLWNLRTLGPLASFWILALGMGWLVSRSMVRPLRHLAAQLPAIEDPEPIKLPEADRQDEIGDLARAFVRTRAALQAERIRRENAEKLAVLGRMTAALAHEVQNPVAAIKMHAQLWQDQEENGGRDAAEVIEREAERIEGLVNQWMYLGKPQPPAMGEVDVAIILAEVLRSGKAQLDHAQVFPTLEVAGPLLMRGDARRLTQVFRNLLVNAIQAMPRGGRLTVSGQSAGGVVTVDFVDEGRGFSGEALHRFAEFFFSEREGGMGIGLSVAQEIVRAHGGALNAANVSPGGGARVTVSLPTHGTLNTAPL